MENTNNSSPKKRLRTVSSCSGIPIMRSGHKAIYTQGRPPWYNTMGQIKEPFVIGICGGSGSGKTTVAKYIIDGLKVPWVSLVSMDSFYQPLTQEQREAASRNEHDFDHPDAMDFDLIFNVLSRLKKGKSVHVPIYDFNTHSRTKHYKIIYGANIIIFEGIMAFESRLLPLMDLKIFVETDADERLDRRLRRDIKERGRTIESVLDQYERYVKPAYESFISPMMKCADIIMPQGGENRVALSMIIPHVSRQLEARGLQLRNQLVKECNGSSINNNDKPSNLHILPESREIKALHTLIRNRATARDDFVFYADRLMRLLFEFAAGLLPYKDCNVEGRSLEDSSVHSSPIYHGRRLAVTRLCAISILRAGETMESAASAVFKDVSVGKILIQTNSITMEPELHYLRLPDCMTNAGPDTLDNTYVMLLDSTVASGAAAMMAIQVLLEHDVPQKNILLVCLLMAAQGAHTLAYVFPEIKIVTTAIDEGLSDNYHILPGIGNFGDRYFGTGLESEDDDDDYDAVDDGFLKDKCRKPQRSLSEAVTFYA